MWERLPDCHIAFLLAVKSALMADAPERFMLRRMQSLLPPGLERALTDLNSIALTRPVSPVQSSSSMLVSPGSSMNSRTAMPVDSHYSEKLDLVFSS